MTQLHEGLNELQELYINLSSRPKTKDGEDLQIKEFKAAEELSTELFQALLASPETALTAQAKLEPEIAFSLLNDSE